MARLREREPLLVVIKEMPFNNRLRWLNIFFPKQYLAFQLVKMKAMYEKKNFFFPLMG